MPVESTVKKRQIFDYSFSAKKTVFAVISLAEDAGWRVSMS
jgi:hypothetical protein